MKYLKLVFTVILGMFLLVSCGDDGITPETQNQPDCYGFTKAEMATVGTLHNKYVTEVYQKVDFLNCNDCSDEIIEAFLEIEIDLSGLNKSKEELITEAEVLYQDLVEIQFDLRNWNNHQFSPESFVHLTTIMEEMDVMNNYDDFEVDMNQLQLTVDSDVSLSCFDLELLTGTIEVAKNSAFLWLPGENGGLDFYSISQEGQVQPRWSWRNAAKADVAASASYFMSLGISGAIGLAVPGSNAAILGGWGLSAGISSALGGA